MEADWIVVGGGSAGALMAARLSEDGSAQVVLLEGGTDWRSADAPAGLRSMNGCARAHPGTCRPRSSGRASSHGARQRRTVARSLRGQGLGGSSAVVGMVAIRAMPDDYDTSAAAGCPGWSYDECCRTCRAWRTAPTSATRPPRPGRPDPHDHELARTSGARSTRALRACPPRSAVASVQRPQRPAQERACRPTASPPGTGHRVGANAAMSSRLDRAGEPAQSSAPTVDRVPSTAGRVRACAAGSARASTACTPIASFVRGGDQLLAHDPPAVRGRAGRRGGAPGSVDADAGAPARLFWLQLREDACRHRRPADRLLLRFRPAWSAQAPTT